MQHILHIRVYVATLNFGQSVEPKQAKTNSDLPFRVYGIREVANLGSTFLHHARSGASAEDRTRVALDVATKQKQTRQHHERKKPPHSWIQDTYKTTQCYSTHKV